jgi:hypothetical protein
MFFDSDHSILRITLSCSQANWLTGSPMDLAQRVRRAIFIVAEKHTRLGRLGQCAVAWLGCRGDLSALDQLYFSTPINRSAGLPSLARKLIGSRVRQWILLNAFGERFLSSLKTHPPRSLGSVRCHLLRFGLADLGPCLIHRSRDSRISRT